VAFKEHPQPRSGNLPFARRIEARYSLVVRHRAKDFEHPAFNIKSVEQEVNLLRRVLEPMLEQTSQRMNKTSADLIERRESAVMPLAENLASGSRRRDGSSRAVAKSPRDGRPLKVGRNRFG